MKKQRERQKRQDFINKLKVIEKEKNNESMVKFSKDREQLLIQRRFDNRIKSNMTKEEFRKTMHSWAHSGFATANNRRERTAGSVAMDFQRSLMEIVLQNSKDKLISGDSPL